MQTVTALLATAALANAAAVTRAVTPTYDFLFQTMQVIDEKIPTVQTNISFLLSTPNNTAAQGGSGPVGCGLHWTDDVSVATGCWKSCAPLDSTDAAGTARFYARLNEYESTDDFHIDIWQGYDRADGCPAHNAATVEVKTGQGDYYCSHGLQTTQCSIGYPFHGISWPERMGYNDSVPTGFPICRD